MMARARASAVGRVRRGGILLEILIAIALFAGAAAFSLGAVRSAFSSMDQTRRKQQAIDLARSTMAELEAGLINISDLRGGDAGFDNAGSNEASTAARNEWSIDAKTYRTEFVGLSLIELTVRENTPPSISDSNAIQYVLRQLVALRQVAAEEYEQDEMMRGAGSGGVGE